MRSLSCHLLGNNLWLTGRHYQVIISVDGMESLLVELGPSLPTLSLLAYAVLFQPGQNSIVCFGAA